METEPKIYAKYLINDVNNTVPDMIEGVSLTYDHLTSIKGYNIIIRKDIESIREKQVTLISGGGSGHEPAHGLFVGKGCLSAAVCGRVFTSPDVHSIVEAILTCTTPNSPGCLLIVKNYTGDVLNFKLAAEICREEKRKVEIVIVDDDCAIHKREKQYEISKRRGIAGTVLCHKIAGAAAELGKSLEEVKKIAEYVIKNISTMGVSLSNCIIPGSQEATFTLDKDEIVMGLGIHGEAGKEVTKIKHCDEIIRDLMKNISQDLKIRKAVLLVNNLGGTTNLEMPIVAKAAIHEIEKKGYQIERVLVGPFMTSLNMHGISLTLLNLSEDMENLILQLLDAETEAPAWPKLVKKFEKKQKLSPSHEDPLSFTLTEKIETPFSKRFEKIIKAIAQSMIDNEPILTHLDQKCGDGDLGQNLKHVGQLALSKLNDLPLHDAGATMGKLTFIIQSMGGSSGALLGMGALKMSQELKKYPNMVTNIIVWTKALNAFVEGIIQLGGAKVGSRTMMDALIPARDKLVELVSNKIGEDAIQANVRDVELNEEELKRIIDEVAKAAEDGTNKTKQIVAKFGRTCNIPFKDYEGIPDPGAKAISIFFNAWKESS